jgi:hypothetical protein
MAQQRSPDRDADCNTRRDGRFAREITYRRRATEGQLAVVIFALNMLVIPYLVVVVLSFFGRLAIVPVIASSLIGTGLGVCGSIGRPTCAWAIAGLILNGLVLAGTLVYWFWVTPS